MRIFCHICEFGPEGTQYIPSLVFMGNKLTLWSPSGRLIDHAYQHGYSCLRSVDVLKLIEAGYLQVMGRRDWLINGPKRQASRWDFAEWSGRFDDRIAEIGLSQERENVAPVERNVVFAPEEGGQDWAEKVYASREPEERQRVAIARRRLKQRSLPQGVLEKADRQQTPKGAVVIVLRDMYNHAEAFNQSGADVPAVPSLFGDSLAEIAGTELQRPYTGPALFSEKLLEVLDVLATISKPRDIDGLLELMERRDREELIAELSSYLAENTSVARYLSVLIDNGVGKREPLLKLLTRPDMIYTTLGALVAALTGLKFELVPQLTLALAALPIGYTVRKWKRMPPHYVGPRLPFILAYDTNQPTFGQIRELCDLLLRSTKG